MCFLLDALKSTNSERSDSIEIIFIEVTYKQNFSIKINLGCVSSIITEISQDYI